MSYPTTKLQNTPIHLNEEELQNPLKIITAFFECYYLPDAIELLDDWMRSAYAEKSRLNKASVLSLLHFKGQLVRLLEAGQLLNDARPILKMGWTAPPPVLSALQIQTCIASHTKSSTHGTSSPAISTGRNLPIRGWWLKSVSAIWTLRAGEGF